MSLFRSQIERERRIDDLMRGRFVDWVVDKQVIAIPPSSESTDLVLHGKVFVDFTWQRVVRVTITNKMQVHLIGDVPLGLEHESQFNVLVAQAEEQCVFLNANQIR